MQTDKMVAWGWSWRETWITKGPELLEVMQDYYLDRGDDLMSAVYPCKMCVL